MNSPFTIDLDALTKKDFMDLQSLKRRLEEQIYSDGFCWFFKSVEGLSLRSSYPAIWFNGKRIPTHHASLLSFKFQRPPKSLHVDHLCKNKHCCNPDHLEIVSPSINMRRSDSASGINAKKTHCPQGHEYTGKNLILDKNMFRKCKVCVSDVKKRMYKKNYKPHPRVLKTHCELGHDLSIHGHYEGGLNKRCRICRNARLKLKRDKDKI